MPRLRQACLVRGNGGALDRFEQEKVTFFEKVRAGYQQLWEQYPERVKRLDATQSPEQVFTQALQYLN